MTGTLAWEATALGGADFSAYYGLKNFQFFAVVGLPDESGNFTATQTPWKGVRIASIPLREACTLERIKALLQRLNGRKYNSGDRRRVSVIRDW